MKTSAASAKDNRQARGAATRRSLMRAAEKLIAQHGFGNVTIRDILTEAEQKNTSALQYHFNGLKGLVEAIHAERSRQTQAKRAELLAELMDSTTAPDLRQLCQLMIRPVFELARAQVDFRRYIKAFGQELALSESSALSQASRRGGGGSSGQQLGLLLRHALSQLDDAAFGRRLESAVRFCAASMYHHARQKNAFRGEEADLFINSLIDALTGLLSAPESEATRAIARRLQQA